MRNSCASAFAPLVALLALAGCGGGGGGNGSSSTTRTTPVRFSLDWATRSKATQGPSSALSATLTLTGASATGGDLVYTVDRNASPNAYTGTYSTTSKAKVGTYPLIVRFYSETAGSGAVVASGLATVTIASDGSGVGTVGIGNTVTSISATAGQTVTVGVSTQLAFTARDSSGNLVALSEGSGVWSQTSGSSLFTLTSAGLATGVAPGTGAAQVTVDGITSAAVPVTVTSAAIASVKVDAGQYTSVGSPKQLTFQALDAYGNPVSIASGSGSWTLTDGSNVASLNSSGVLTPRSAGTVSVQVTAAGKTSDVVTISVTSAPVASVTVDAGQTVRIGESKQLTLIARDADGNIVAVPASGAAWTKVDNDPDATLTSSGVATGVGGGTLFVTATVNGVTSPQAQISVVGS